MRTEVFLSAVGIAGTLLGVILGHLLRQLTQTASERGALVEELTYWKTSIQLEAVRNFLPVHLHGLREFFLRNAQLLLRRGNRDFFTKWLTETYVVEGTAVNVISLGADRLEELCRDLEDLRA